MFNFFKKKKTTKKGSDFKIEYYPLSRNYFPKYRNYYLRRNLFTCEIVFTQQLIFGDSFISEEDARNFIDEFKEQEFKETMKIIEC